MNPEYYIEGMSRDHRPLRVARARVLITRGDNRLVSVRNLHERTLVLERLTTDSMGETAWTRESMFYLSEPGTMPDAVQGIMAILVQEITTLQEAASNGS